MRISSLPTYVKINATITLVAPTGLYDSQSTTSVIKNRDLLSNIRESIHPITFHSNGGIQVSFLVGRLNSFGDV